jgi:glucose-1-phosphate cytidylyltransferase
MFATFSPASPRELGYQGIRRLVLGWSAAVKTLIANRTPTAPGAGWICDYASKHGWEAGGGFGVKVVIFCGGLGVRMGDATRAIPKPMVSVGTRPILWHIMKWYAAWGHTEFTLCLGYRGETIKDYFLNYREALSNDFVLSNGGRDVQLLARDMDDWRVTFVDTGMHSTIAERLKAVEEHIGDDRMFLATYGDGLTDAPLDDMIGTLERTGKTALFISVKPRVEYHLVKADGDGIVSSVDPFARADVWINGGFFVLRREIFDELNPGEELIDQPFKRLIERGELVAYRYEGFWEPMDTIKDKQKLDELVETRRAPWLIGPAQRT